VAGSFGTTDAPYEGVHVAGIGVPGVNNSTRWTDDESTGSAIAGPWPLEDVRVEDVATLCEVAPVRPGLAAGRCAADRFAVRAHPAGERLQTRLGARLKRRTTTTAHSNTQGLRVWTDGRFAASSVHPHGRGHEPPDGGDQHP
jgi:hypothetical protein